MAQDQQGPWGDYSPSSTLVENEEEKKKKKSLGKKVWGVTGRPAFSALEFLGKGLAGATLFPVTRTIENIMDTAKPGGEQPSIGHYLKDIIPVPFTGKEIWGKDILEKAGAGGWLQGAMGKMAQAGGLFGLLPLQAAAMYGATSPEAAATVAGMGIDIAADPLTYVSGGLTKLGRVSKLAELTEEGSKIGRLTAKFKAAGKLLPLGETMAERMRAGQSGMKFMGKLVLPKAQAAVAEKLAPAFQALKESKLGAMVSTKGGPPELVAVRDIINNELHGRPDLMEQIGAQYGKRSKFVKEVARKHGFNKDEVDRVLSHITETKPAADAPPYLGIQYKRMEDALDPAVFTKLRFDPEVDKFANEIRGIMTNIADKELQAGVLRNVFETDVLDYLTHLITPEGRSALKKSGGHSLLRKFYGLINPSDQPRRLLVPTDDISLVPEGILKASGKGGAAARGEKAAAQATTVPGAMGMAVPAPTVLEMGTEAPSRVVTRPHLMFDFTSRARGNSPTIQALHIKNGGSTVNLWRGDMIGQDAWSISIYPERSTILHGKDIAKEAIHKYIMDNADLLRDPRLSTGTWFDTKSGNTYLDVVLTLPGSQRDLALALGKKFNQKAIFNLKTFEEIPTGGTGTVMRGWEAETARLASIRPDSGKRLTLYHFSDKLPAGKAEVSPQYMGASQMGEERLQFKSPSAPAKSRLQEGYLPKANFYAEGTVRWEPHRWVGQRLYKIDVDPNDLLIIGKEGIEGNPDILAAEAGKIGWYSEYYQQARIITPVTVEQADRTILKGKKPLPRASILQPAKGGKIEYLPGSTTQVPLAMQDARTGKVFKALPNEHIHADIFMRMEKAGVKDADMRPGWTMPDGSFTVDMSKAKPTAPPAITLGTAPPTAPPAGGGGLPFTPKPPAGYVQLPADELMKMLPGMPWKIKKQLLDAGILKYPAISEVNQLAREGKLFAGRKVEQFFYEDPAKITALRQIRSAKALSSARILEDARGVGLKDGWAIPLEKGKPIPAGYDVVRSPLTTDVAFERDVAGALSGMQALLQNPSEMAGLIHAYKRTLQFWKVWTLMPFPSYHFRNVFGGNLFNQALGGMNPLKEGWWNPQGANAIAARIQSVNKAKNAALLGEAPKPRGLRWATETLTADTGAKYTLSEIDDLARKAGLYRGGQFTADIFEDAKSIGKMRKGLDKLTYNKATELGMKVGSALEDNAKVGMFVHYLRQGYDAAESAKMANKFIFDYFDIPPIVRTAKNFAPFITWYYKNIPLQLEYMVRKPYVFASIYKVQQGISEGKQPHPAVVTSYYKESMPVVISKKKDKALWLSLAKWTPTADINILAQPKSWFSMLYPGIKAPIELAANKDVFFNQPISELGKRTPFLGAYIPNAASYLLRQFRPFAAADLLNPGGILGTETKKAWFGLGQKREGKFEPPEAMRWARAITGIRTYQTDVPRATASKINKLTREVSLLRSRYKFQADEKEQERIKEQIHERQREIKMLRAYRY